MVLHSSIDVATISLLSSGIWVPSPPQEDSEYAAGTYAPTHIKQSSIYFCLKTFSILNKSVLFCLFQAASAPSNLSQLDMSITKGNC